MPENRKILVEVLDGGEIILSANFDANCVRHEMRAFAVHDYAAQAAHEVQMCIENKYGPDVAMLGDGTIPRKPGAQHGPDDIPF